jgi:hypothetical protein
MAYTPHVLVVFGGTWTLDPGEVWECSVRISADGGGGVTIDPDAYLAAIHDPLKTWFTAVGTAMCNNAVLGYMKANHIAADGTYVDKTVTHLFDYPGGVVGAQDPKGPQFISLAYTWETALKRGPGHRGRIFPPNGVLPVQVSAFKINAAGRDEIATNGAGLLAVLKNSAGANGTKGTPIIASKINGALTPIIGCSADDIFDVQRRRKNRIKGTRSAIVPFA